MRRLIQLTVTALLVLQPSIALAKSEWVIVTAGGNGDRYYVHTESLRYHNNIAWFYYQRL